MHPRPTVAPTAAPTMALQVCVNVDLLGVVPELALPRRSGLRECRTKNPLGLRWTASGFLRVPSSSARPPGSLALCHKEAHEENESDSINTA